ncbi:LOW QUALITY PROTEIN: hypothetical protein BRADI_2g44286v3 [Brachypodium distachyon]|uniref:Uncharacterized protein n=1 Tax=Brachypodium distachyon TaxID=15368 RepID=A0A2K2DDU1_BRADI|nr:LOW QUALITY PROTEIN: hypothetical protein BRADI_2g44286v3 [Brachypodium distachyon]
MLNKRMNGKSKLLPSGNLSYARTHCAASDSGLLISVRSSLKQAVASISFFLLASIHSPLLPVPQCRPSSPAPCTASRCSALLDGSTPAPIMLFSPKAHTKIYPPSSNPPSLPFGSQPLQMKPWLREVLVGRVRRRIEEAALPKAFDQSSEPTPVTSPPSPISSPSRELKKPVAIGKLPSTLAKDPEKEQQRAATQSPQIHGETTLLVRVAPPRTAASPAAPCARLASPAPAVPCALRRALPAWPRSRPPPHLARHPLPSLARARRRGPAASLLPRLPPRAPAEPRPRSLLTHLAALRPADGAPSLPRLGWLVGHEGGDDGVAVGAEEDLRREDEVQPPSLAPSPPLRGHLACARGRLLACIGRPCSFWIGNREKKRLTIQLPPWHPRLA